MQSSKHSKLCRWTGDRLAPPTLSLTVEQSYTDVPLNPRNSSLPVVGRSSHSAKKGSGAVAAAGKQPLTILLLPTNIACAG